MNSYTIISFLKLSCQNLTHEKYCDYSCLKMMNFEEFKNNVEVNDKFGVNNIKANKKYVYNGHHKIFTYTNKDDKNSQPLAAAVLGLRNTDIPLSNDVHFHNCWNDMDAQESYLKLKPKTFLIIGKQGTGSYSLGESLSKKISCIHICPKNVLLDEIEQKSITGQCLDFNMRHNKVIKFNTILSIVKEKIKSPAVQHRGFVISGLPLVTSSKDIQYLINTLNGEVSLWIVEYILFDLICNLNKKRIKNKTTPNSSMSSENFETAAEVQVEEEQEPEPEAEENDDQIVELPKFLLQTCSNIIFPSKVFYSTKKNVLLQQLCDLFDLKPDIIIHITCPNSDAVRKRTHKFLNYLSSTNTFSPFATNVEHEIRWPKQYVMTDYKKPFDTHSFNPKYNCTQPIHLKKNAADQICNFKAVITSFIDEKLKGIHPDDVIKLDGRTSIYEMTNHIIEILRLMLVKPVLIPEPLYLDDVPDDIEEFWRKVEELNVIRSGTMNFKRYASPWYNRCPVELKKRQSVIGNPKFAVTFFKHIYLLSSLNAMVSFCRNPRPFLKLEYFEPTCRIIILGTKSSGKTMIANCLSWIFNAPIISYTSLLKSERFKKYNSYAKTILSEIIATIEDVRFAKWQNMELERVSNLNTWFNTVSSLLNRYIPLLVKKINQEEEESKDEGDHVFLSKFDSIRNQLSFLPTFFLDDLHKCQDILTDKNLLRYAPMSLTTETSKPTIPSLGDEDVTEEISAYIRNNDLQKEIEPTPEELMIEIIHIIQTIDSSLNAESPLEQVYGKFIIDGFPSDPEYWGYLFQSKLLPDYTISLIENREVDAELMQHYIKIEKCHKNYQERYLSANDVLLKTKLLQVVSPDIALIDVQVIIDELVTNALDFKFFNENTGNTFTEKSIETDLLTFVENIQSFQEDWDILKLKLEDNLKSFIEVELGDKSDIQIIDEVLLKVRKAYCRPCLNSDEDPDSQRIEQEFPEDDLTYNDLRSLGETSIYCPMTFYNYGVLWEGKPEFSAIYDNKLYYFSNEECREALQYDITKHLSYNEPFKNIPQLRICIVGSIGSGKTTISKIIAKELGLMHINFADFLNTFLIPKHFKKVGWQYENSFTDSLIDEEAVELQMDEETLDILSNEQELRSMVYNYFEQGLPLMSVLMHMLLKKLWFKNPYKNTGFVLDGFPKLPSDVEDMVTCYCIPDIIIELQGSSESTLDRLSSMKFQNWKSQLHEAKAKAKNKLETERAEWHKLLTKRIVIKLIVDEILENLFSDTEEPIMNLSNQVSTIMDAHPSGSSNVDANLFITYNEFIREYPEPVDQNEWEKPEDVRERINNRLESIYEINEENIQALKEIVNEQNIKLISLDGTKALDKVVRRALSILSKFRDRCESFFEQTFIINCDVAEMLLLEGFFLLSKFNRMCPVFIVENPHTIFNSYNLNKGKNKIFPIIHRAYIYFISSEENVKKFRFNPLKYIQNDSITFFKRYTLRIGVIGPPKSGKSTLAAKLAKKYGLICISKGTAIRHVLEHMDWTSLALKMMTSIRAGEVIDKELTIKAVQTVAIDHRTITNGFVLDGCPESPFDVCELSENGLFPLIIFDLNTDKEIVLANSQNEKHYSILKRKPPYPLPFIEYRYSKWYDKCLRVRDWINQDSQNLYVINGNNSKWQCFDDACLKIEDIMPKIHCYLTHSKSEIVRLDVMCITKDTFHQRMSCYQNLCPVCFQQNTLRHNGYPPDNKGLVQFEDCFYWICRDHLNLVLQYPHEFLTFKEIHIPEIPVVVKSINLSLVYENGICTVTYMENLPSQKLLRGKNKYAAAYKKKTYLFCSSECLNKFLIKPHMYYNVKVDKDISTFPKITLPKLPHLGYLEQTVGSIITNACCAVNELRPKYPGLTTSMSALLYIALYLKIHNPITNESGISMYSKPFKIFEVRCKLMIEIGLRLQSMNNPFVNYPNCCDKSTKLQQIDSGTVRKPSSVISTSTTSLYFDSDFNTFS